MAQYTKPELSKKPIADLRDLAEKHDLEFEDEKPTKAQLIAGLLEVEDEDIEDELDEEIEPELEDEEDDEPLPEEDEDDLELPDEEEVDEVDEPAPAKKTRAKRTPAADKPAKAEASGDTLVAKQVATILNTEAKTLRQFFRSDSSTIEPVGAGGRYEFAKTDIDKIKSEFEAWKAGHASRGSARGSKKEAAAEKFEEVEEVEGIDELSADDIEEDDLELEDEDDK